ncbi:MAG: ABC transporter ATP-binding protein [Pseudomonadota bacterium]|nr:ABC transporter ATP-binding protein [Pseudomonadota bacterium]
MKLSIRGVGKTYGTITALSGASLELAEGEFLTLLGPSGSGKTTLLMVVAGLVQPSGGEVWIDGKLATYAPPDKRDIGVVFQNYALFPHLTIAENVGFPLKMRRLPAAKIADEVRRVLDIVRLPHVAARFPRELSGGQQQRIALARCMVYGPSIILMDEPLGALDRKLRDQMQLEIKGLHARLGITVLYVTHDQEEALVMSDRICLMNNGRIEQIGTPQDLYFRPRTIFAADFLGESNILDGTVTAVDDLVTVRGPADLSIRARSDVVLRVGEPVKLVIRPESLRLLEPGELSDNVAHGTLRDVVFVGGVSRSFVTLAGGLMLSLKQLTGRGGDAISREGDVRVGWEAERTIVLPIGEGG